MRPTERIPIVLKLINWYDFFKALGIAEEAEIEKWGDYCISKHNEIYDYWIAHPDERLTQVLVNSGIIDNIPGMWYYKEETEYLIEEQGVPPEAIS